MHFSARRVLGRACGLVLCLAAAGCAERAATSDIAEVAAVDATKLEFCTEPRPEICTMDYVPVCGHRCAEPPCPEEARRTYSNGCTACSDAEVTAWTAGECAGDPTR